MYTWVRGNTKSCIATLYTTNITLNNIAATYFADIRWCLLGVDEEEKKLAIKPVTKREVDLNLVSVTNLHKVSLGKGYARISNKAVINHIAELLQVDCNGIKFESVYDEKEKMLIVDLNKPVVGGV